MNQLKNKKERYGGKIMVDIDKLNKNITNNIIKIKKDCETYLWYVNNLSRDYGSVMKIEDVINKSKKLEKDYKKVIEEFYKTESDEDA